MTSDLQAAAGNACNKIGVIFHTVPTDGRFHQLDVDGKTPRNGAGRIRIYADGAGGQVWNHVTGDTLQFWTQSEILLTPAEMAERKRRAKEEREKAERELADARQKAAQLAIEVWRVSLPPVDPLYWKRKQVEPTDTIREIQLDTLVDLIGYHPKAKGKPFTGNKVQIIPVRGDKGISTIEMIDETGLKAGLADGQKKGCFWATGKLPGGDGTPLTFTIGEGVSTVLSGLKALPDSIGIAALSCNNLMAVSKHIRRHYPAARIIMLSDIGNGEQAAVEAARSVNALIVKPLLPEGSIGSDLNDVHCELGIDEAWRQIKAAISSSQIAAPPLHPRLESSESGAWQEPILFGDIKTPEIPCSILTGWLGEYAAAVAATTQTPPGMSVMMALSVVAACIQKRFQVARTPEHIEPLALWTATALPPASRKSAVVNAFTGPITEWEKEQSIYGQRERNRVDGIREAIENRIKVLQVLAGKTNDADERNRLVDETVKLREEMPEPLIAPRIFTGDSTAERLQSLMMEQNERMAVLSDEGGIFAVMAGLYSGGKANIDIFLKGHAGSAVRVDRQGRTAHLDEPALTFGLCIQPDIIRQLSDTSFRGNGCLARFLFCLPTSNIGTRAAKTIPMPENIKTAYQTGISSLLNIPPLFDEHGRERARTITIDLESAQAWEAFFNFIEAQMGEGKVLEPIQDWSGKLAGAALRIAGLMMVVEQGEAASVINEATMTRALDLAKLLILHARSAFDLMDSDDAQHDAKHVYRWIVEKGTGIFKQSDVYRELRRFNDAERLNKALKALSARHIISQPIKSGTGGRPSISFEVNPSVFVKART